MSRGSHVTVADYVARSGVDGPWWIAHEHPERPLDQWVLASSDCDPCVMALIAAAAVQPDLKVSWYFPDGDSSDSPVPIPVVVAKMRRWRDDNGLRSL